MMTCCSATACGCSRCLRRLGVHPACRQVGVHHSTYHRWKQKVDRRGSRGVGVRERRRRMPNQFGSHLEQGGDRFRARPSGLRAQAHLGRAGPREVGRHSHLGARRLAGAGQSRAQHALQTAGAEGVRASVCGAEATGFMCRSGSRSPKWILRPRSAAVQWEVVLHFVSARRMAR
jgi:hypothetical protein